MSEALFALRDLAEPGVNLQWFEAVAVTLGMADAWPEGAGTVVPFEAFTITGEGAIRALPHALASADPARELGIALQAMLVDPTAPRDLRELAQAAAQSAPGTPLASHVRALAYFERPDRARILLFLAQRVVPQLATVDVEEELRRLGERMRDRAERSKPPGPWVRGRAWIRNAWRQWKPVVGVLVVLAALGGAAWAFQSSPTLRSTVWAPVEKVVTWVRPARTETPAATKAEPDAAPEAGTRTTPRTPTPRADRGPATLPPVETPVPQAARVSPPPPDAPPAEASPALPPVIRDIQPYEPAAPVEIGGTEVEGIGLVYRQGDPGVVPARLERRYLPTVSPDGVSATQTGAFELVVDERGQVLQVRLVSPGNRYQERMLLAAAKAWRFTPATKDGVPVKFVTHVKVTW